MSILSFMFAVLVTPSGTTTLEVIGWVVCFALLIVWKRRSEGVVEAEEGSTPRRRDESFVNPYLNEESSTLRRRPISFDTASGVPIQSTASVPSEDDGPPLTSRIAEEGQPGNALGTILRYLKLMMVAYLIDAVFFLVISICMCNSILFIPTPCDDSAATAVCNYSFPFDDEMYWTNPRTNDTLHVLFIRGRGTGDATRQRPVLFTHGNSHNVAHPRFRTQYDSLSSLGLDVYAWDYPGYGKSRLDPSSTMSLQRFHDDAEFVLEKVGHFSATNARDVILWGFSMGGAISTALAVQHRIKTLILQYPPDRFDWIVREGTKLTGWLSALPQYKVLDVLSLNIHVRSPTRVLHLAAEFDHYVTLARQKKLYEQLPVHVRAQSRFVTVGGVGHDASPFQDPKISSILESFLSQH